MNNAQLPIDLEERTLSHMEDGESGYTVPWGMFADRHGSLWLNGGYTVHDEPGGTVQLLVTKTPSGFEVDASRCPDKRWHRDVPGYVGEFEPLPVVAFRR